MHTSIERVMGMKKYKGDIDGKSIDSCTIYVETRLDDRSGLRRGRATADYNAGTSDVYDRLSKIDLPAEFEITWDTVTNGKESKQLVIDVKPMKIDLKKI